MLLLPALGWQLLLSQVAFTRCFEIERQIFSSKGRCDKHQHQPSGRQRTRGQTRIRYRFWPHVSAHALLLAATSARTHPHRPPHSARTLCRWPTMVSHERLLTVINHQSASSFKHCLPVEHSPRKPHTAPLCMCCATPLLPANYSSHEPRPLLWRTVGTGARRSCTHSSSLGETIRRKRADCFTMPLRRFAATASTSGSHQCILRGHKARLVTSQQWRARTTQAGYSIARDCNWLCGREVVTSVKRHL